MPINFSLINIIVLFGALQGFLLCWVLYKKRATNPKAAKFLILFLFSLSFLNLDYALMDMGVLDAYPPIYMLPFPYKYLLAPVFLLYVYGCLRTSYESKLKQSVFFLFIPAVIYGILRCYWFFIAVKENSYRIVAELVVSDFFRVNEFVYLVFTLGILLYTWRLVMNAHTSSLSQGKKTKNFPWLKRFAVVFLAVVVINLVLTVVDLIIHEGDDTMLFNYPNLIINSAFIYWIGYIGLLNSYQLLPSIRSKNVSASHSDQMMIQSKLLNAMEVQELYKDKDLSLADLARLIDLPAKDISSFINEVLHKNFSEYLNQYRVDKVKALIASSDFQKYTLLALAEEAGFKSKSAFHATFKRVVGLTPTEYKRELTQEK